MKILIASRCLPLPIHFGDRLILFHLLKELSARGHQCDVVAFYQSPQDLVEAPHSAALCRELEPIEETPRSALQYVARLARPFPARSDQCWNPRMWNALAYRIASRVYDVVHFFGGIQIYEFRGLVARLPSVIVPYESHSLFLESALADARSPAEWLRHRLALSITRRYERLMYGGHDRVVVLSPRDREALRALTPGLPIDVIPNGVDPVESSVEPRLGAELVFVGNYTYLPNVRAALTLVNDVLPRVRARIPEARVVLVGASPPPEIVALASGDVEVTGQVPIVQPYLARGRCFVASITSGAGTKNKILESLAAGLPVVTTPAGYEGLAVTPGEQLLVGSTASDLAEATIRVLSDSPLAQRLGAAGRQFVRAHHDWSKVAERYEALYATVAAERTAAVNTRVIDSA